MSDDLRPSLMTTIVLGSISAFAPVAIEMYLPALPQIAQDLRSPPGGAELTISIFLIALAGGQLVYGPLSDRYGRRRPLLAGMIIFCLASAACALSTSINQLIAFRFIQGFGGCAGQVIVRAIVRDRYPSSRLVQILAALSMVSGLAPMLAPLAGGAVLTVASWRAILWTQAIFGTVVTLSTILHFKKEHDSRRPIAVAGVLESYWIVITNARLMMYVLYAAFGCSVIFIYGALMPGIAHARFGLSAQQLSYTLAVGAGGMLTCAQINRPLLRRFTSDQLLKTANLVSVFAAVVLCVDAWTDTGAFPGLIAPLLLIISLCGITMPNAAASALLSENRHVGVASAIFGMGAFAGGALMSGAAAKFVDGTAKPLAGGVLVGLLFGFAALWVTPRVIQRPVLVSRSS